MKKLSGNPKNAYFREMYAWRKAHHICVKCGQRDAKKGHTRCISCAEKEQKRNAQKRALSKSEYHTEEYYRQLCRTNKLYDLRVAFGVCTDCGKRNAAPGYTKCTECLIRCRRKSEEKRRKSGIYPRDGYSELCKMCNKKAPLNGKKLCEECYEKSLRNLKEANAARDNANHFWHGANHIAFRRYESEPNGTKSMASMKAGGTDGDN